MEGKGVRQYQLKAGKQNQVVTLQNSFCCGCGCLGKPTHPKKTHTIHNIQNLQTAKTPAILKEASKKSSPPQTKASQRNKNSTTLHPGRGQLRLLTYPKIRPFLQETLLAQRRPSLADNGLKDTMPPTKILGSVASARGCRSLTVDSFGCELFLTAVKCADVFRNVNDMEQW